MQRTSVPLPCVQKPAGKGTSASTRRNAQPHTQEAPQTTLWVAKSKDTSCWGCSDGGAAARAPAMHTATRLPPHATTSPTLQADTERMHCACIDGVRRHAARKRVHVAGAA
jgi:hypothetical protein